MTSQLQRDIEQHGFALVPQAVTPDVVSALLAAIGTTLDNSHEDSDTKDSGASVRRNSSRPDSIYAIRNLLDAVPIVRDVAQSASIRSLIEPVLGPGCFPVRGILFDKTPGANWKVPWHQDLSIAVRDKIEVPGFSPWSLKAGVPHVQPPAAILEQMLTLRLHLDDCHETNGPLRVIPGSHRTGKLDAASIRDWRERCAHVSCPLPRGGALLMRPLLLHASSPATSPGHRRVVHLEWAADKLPNGLQWHI